MDVNRLTAIPIFSELSEQEARRLGTFATETSAAEGQILIKKGDYPVELIAIEEGTADVIQGGEKIASLGPGDLIGEMGLLERRPRNAESSRSRPTNVVSLPSPSAKAWPWKARAPATRLYVKMGFARMPTSLDWLVSSV